MSAHHEAQIRNRESLRDSSIGQHAGPIEQQELVNVGHHHLSVKTVHPLVPSMDLGRGFARLSRGTARQHQHTNVQTHGECEKAQPETSASFFPIFYRHRTFLHIPFSNVPFNGRAVFRVPGKTGFPNATSRV
jgi:hypothetical protein